MIEDCRFIDLPKLSDSRGSLSFVESEIHIPFDIKRVYYLYEIPNGVSRGAHAHKNLEQFIIPMSGSFDVLLDDGYKKKNFHLSQPNMGLYIPPMMWRDLVNFSSSSVCLVLASENYTENDYIRNYEDFISISRGRA